MLYPNNLFVKLLVQNSMFNIVTSQETYKAWLLVVHIHISLFCRLCAEGYLQSS